MKTLFTLLTCFLLSILISVEAHSQTCNTSAGSNGNSLALASAINVDGNMSDWAPYLNDPDNNSYDNTGGVDLDILTLGNSGRDLKRFTFTEDMNNLYFYLERASGSNNTDVVFYVDINNNDVMDSREPVYHLTWQASQSSVGIESLNYNPSLLNAIVNTLSLNLDGAFLMGTLTNRGNSGPGSPSAKGSADGKSIEVKIPFTQITRQDASGNVINQLAFGQNFKFHVSTINGNISSIPGLNSINDNFGGCMVAPTQITATLPVKLMEFTARYDRTNVILNWESAQELNFSHYVIEKSNDGINYNEAALVFGAALEGSGAKYNYTDRSVQNQGGMIYYRLRMVDNDGKISYSPVRIISLDQKKEQVSIHTFPNPVSEDLRIAIPMNWQGKKISYELINSNGQSILSREVSNGSQTETISMRSAARGLYLIKVSCGTETSTQTIIKQ